MPRPRVYDESLRARLIAAAAEAIAAGGVDGLSLRQVATTCDTSTNAVYTLFGGKDELVAAVVEEATGSFSAGQRAVRRTSDALADLVELGRAYRTWVLEHPALYTVLMGGRVPATALSGNGWLSDPRSRPLLDAVTRAVEEGRLAGADVEQMAITLWAGVHGLVTLETALWSELEIAERDRRFDEHLFWLACGWIQDPIDD